MTPRFAGNNRPKAVNTTNKITKRWVMGPTLSYRQGESLIRHRLFPRGD